MATRLLMLLNGCQLFNMAGNGSGIGVCYFALQTLQAFDKIYRQNNNTKPLLVAGAVN